MAVFTTYNVTTNREDLSDVIKLLNPNNNWVYDNTKHGKATARYIEWPMDALTTPTGNTNAVEGADSDDAALTAATGGGNYCEITRVTGKISNTQIKASTAGEHGTYEHQIMKSGKTWKNKVEFSIVTHTGAVSGTSAVARQTKGLIGWIATNTTTGASTASNITEAEFNDNLQLIWAQCGDPEGEINTICGAYQKRRFSAFTGVSASAITIPAEKKKVVSSITVIDTDFGLVNIHKHHVLNANAPDTIITMFDMDCWELAFFRPPQEIKLATVGDSRRFMIIGEYGIRSIQEKKSGKITGVKSS